MLSASETEAVIRVIYLALFGREPDRDGQSHFRTLLQAGDASAIESLLATATGTEEYRLHQLDKTLASLAGTSIQNTRRAGDTRHVFKHVISLGTHCFTSFLLKRAGLKKYSGPFDWTFSSPGMVRHCLQDDFVTFLDRSFHEVVPVELRHAGPNYNKCHHTYYRREFGVEHVFNHHDLTDDNDYAYFSRCVARFRAVTSSGEPTLLLQCTRYTPNIEAEFRATADVITRISPTSRLLVIAIQPQGSLDPAPLFKNLVREDGHELIRMDAVSRWSSLAFLEPIDYFAVLNVLRQFEIRPAPVPQFLSGSPNVSAGAPVPG